MSESKDHHHKSLNPAYKEAVFEFVSDGKPEDFWVITAYNPDGKDTDAKLNGLADEKLYLEMTVLGGKPFRVVGLSPDRSHAEPGWGASLDEATAIELGRKFRQEAKYQQKRRRRPNF